MDAPRAAVPDLEVNDLAVVFPGGDAPAVDLARLRVAAGDRVALTGPSGSGKTTLAYALTGIQPLARGSVRWGATDLATLGEAARDRWRLATIGLVFQEFHLVPGMSPLANVLATTWFTSLRPSPALVARAGALLERFGVPRQRVDVLTLSRGEQQRVAIARALLHEPPVLVADEPTASLDAASGAEVIRLLLGGAEGGRTLLVVTHDARMIERCDRVLRLERGRLVGDERAAAPASASWRSLPAAS